MFSGQYFKVGSPNNAQSGYEVINVKLDYVVTWTKTLVEANRLASEYNKQVEWRVSNGYHPCDGDWYQQREYDRMVTGG